jgi:trigger factor
VEVGPELVSQTREELVKQFSKDVKLPGFRQGKVPRAMVEKRFGKEISEELESRMVSKTLDDAIRQKGLKVIEVSNVEDVKLGLGEGLSFTATLVTVPEFELPSYQGIAVTLPADSVSEADVDRALEGMRERLAEFVDMKEDRGALMEDFVVVDYQGTIGGKAVHEAFPKVGSILSSNEGFWIRMTEESFFPGFCAPLVGARPGETRSFQIEVPADFPVEGFAGQKIDYSVTLKEIKTRVLPELNDEFASGFVKGKTLSEIREMVRGELESSKKREVEGLKRDKVMDYLLSQVECELPENMARAESNRVLSEVIRENQSRGVTQEMLKENEKELVATASQTARNRLKSSFILSRIAEREEIRVTREELLGRIAAIAKESNMSLDKALKEVSKRRLLPQIQSEILTAKALDFVASAANVTVEAAG